MLVGWGVVFFVSEGGGGGGGGGHIIYILSVILSFCNSVILSSSLKLPCDKTFPWIPLCFTLWPWSLILFWGENFNLANNFWTVSAGALIFHMSILRDKTLPLVPLFFTLWTWPWSLTHFWKILTLIVSVSVIALINHIDFHCDKTFPGVPQFLILLISWEHWVLDCLYSTLILTYIF